MANTASRLGACAALLVTLVGAAPAPDRTAADFARPPVAARPWVRWWWPGGDVTDAELQREIGVLSDSGFGGAEVQPFNPGIIGLDAARRARVDDYATPAFFARMQATMTAAAARGLKIDYTFGSAWPSGGGFAITPERALRELTMAHTEIDGGTRGPLRLDLPKRRAKLGGVLGPLDQRTRDPRAAGWKARFDAIDHVVAVVALRGVAADLKPKVKGGFDLFAWQSVIASGQLDPASAVILTDRLKPDGTLDWAPPAGTWQVFVFKEFAANVGISAGVGAGPQLVADHFDPAAFAAHATRVGDPLMAALGPRHPGMSGTFVDSLELMPDLYWSRDFLAEFRRRRGYDLAPYLPLILQPGWMQAWGEFYSKPYYNDDTTGRRVREDYRTTVSDLFLERFARPFVAWNHDHGLLARFQAHGAPVDILQAYGLADVPETEDLVDNANPYFMRLARSAANLYGRPIVSAESLCFQFRPYAVTLEMMRRRAGLIFASGVNRLVIHGFPYAYQGDRWPGWHPFAPSPFGPGFSSFLAETNPLWAGVPQLAGWIGRMQAVLKQGRAIVPVAMFLGETGYYSGIETQGTKGDALVRGLIEAGYDNDRINPDAIASAHVQDRMLVTAGGARYAALVLPPIEAIDPATAQRIAGFAAAGLPVRFVDRAPVRARGLEDAPRRDAAVVAAVAEAGAKGATTVTAADLAETLRAARVPANLRFATPAAGLVFVERRIGARTIYLIHNPAETSRDASFTTAASGPASRWDAMDGTIRSLPAEARGGETAVPLTLTAGETALIAIGGPAALRAKPATADGARMAITGWALTVSGHGTGGVPIAQAVPLTSLADFATLPGMAAFSGTATYRATLTVPAGWLARGRHATLDLVAVHDMATVSVNGRALPPLIGAPWRVDVGRLLRPGRNRLEVAVANSPQNAMIDATKAGYKTLRAVPAGLIGPVTLIADR